MISYAIMAHPQRAQMVDELEASLDHEHTVHWDEGNGRWETGERAWLSYDAGAKWHVVIQDDAVLCTDFAERCEDFLLSCPKGPASLYLGAGRPRQAEIVARLNRLDEIDDRIALPKLIWGVCLALPTDMIGPMLDACASGVPQYDGRMGLHFQRLGVPCVHSWPSLADHRDEDSIVHARVGCERVAHWFADNPRPERFSHGED